jgi:transposase-like protein
LSVFVTMKRHGKSLKSITEDEAVTCPKCDSPNIQWRGYAYTQAGQFHRYVCNDCGGWARSRYQINKKNEALLTNAVS